MARGRFISESVAKDARLNSLSVEAQLVYLMTVPHLDRDGLIEGDPDVLWGTVCPKRRQFLDRMAEFIQEWAKAELVLMYDSDDGPVLWFKGFAKNQMGMRYDREAPSKFPPPPDSATPDQLRTNSGNCRAEVKDQVEVKDEGKAEAAAPAAVNDRAQLWAFWERNMPGTRTPVIVDAVNALLDDYSVAEVEEAITIACKQNKRTLRYVEGILSKGAFSTSPSTTAQATNNGLAAILDYSASKGMFNERNR